MEKLYIITGANGHVGSTIIKILKESGERIRGLIMSDEIGIEEYGNITYFNGNICDMESLKPLFENCENYQTIVIHTAGIISIADNVSPKVYNVNVNGTNNVLEISLKHKVHRFIYTSSVHAIPEVSKYRVIKEVNSFSPDLVHGEYAKTKAIATQNVLDYVKKGLNAVIVQPSGIIGPFSTSDNHLVQLIESLVKGKMFAGVKGGYDFVDVRDVAYGCLKASEKGKIGECYILSNRHYSIKTIFEMIREINGGKKIPILPMWFAKMWLRVIEYDSRRKHIRPLYTKYSLYTLTSNDHFSHDKATMELGYSPRDMYDTIEDTVKWFKDSKADIKL